jgi:hypothetical protein
VEHEVHHSFVCSAEANSTSSLLYSFMLSFSGVEIFLPFYMGYIMGI